MRRTELVRRLAALRGFERPDPRLEQVATPPEAAAELLETVAAFGAIADRTVADLGTGTGILAIGASLLGARRVLGVDADPTALGIARENAARAGVAIELSSEPLDRLTGPVDTVVMNPPFGAQRRHADRPFWAAADRLAGGPIGAFALADSRTFIVRWAVARRRPVVETRPVRWTFAASFPHHRKPSVELPVELWVIGAPATP